MGLFLAMSGVIGADGKAVAGAVEEYAVSRSGGMEERAGNTDQPNFCIVAQGGDNTTVFYPNHFVECDEISQSISKMLGVPVFSLQIIDGDLWMYLLYENGTEVGRFNPIPDYFEELDDAEREKWRGDPDVVCRLVPGVNRADIERYFVWWDLEEAEPLKAYPDDEYDQMDWQLLDFMRKIGLVYPIDDEGEPIGNTYRLWTKDTPLE